jgi:peptidoglycan lytic transglycosylase B
VRARLICASALTALVAAAPAAPQEPETPRPPFAEWLADLRTEALTRGIREDIVDAALEDVVEPQPVILERDRTQAEVVFSLEKYIARQLTPRLIKGGRDAYAAHRELLEKVAQRYGVPSKIIVAIWGMESNYGRFSGVRPIVPALATLAWDPRRAAFFRGELFDALEIVNRGDIDLPRLRGSWAGAMGQVQFMPSSYLKFAEDFDGDGRRDIWSTTADVFASIANYLQGHGWTANESWGREVKVTASAESRISESVPRRSGTCAAMRNMAGPLPLTRWQELGVRLPGGARLPKRAIEASLVAGDTRHFLAYSNYDALLEYNCAHSYAISVALLGDAVASSSPVKSTPSKSAAPKKKPARPPAPGAKP